jgi:hypothetical protein
VLSKCCFGEFGGRIRRLIVLASGAASVRPANSATAARERSRTQECTVPTRTAPTLSSSAPGHTSSAATRVGGGLAADLDRDASGAGCAQRLRYQREHARVVRRGVAGCEAVDAERRHRVGADAEEVDLRGQFRREHCRLGQVDDRAEQGRLGGAGPANRLGGRLVGRADPIRRAHQQKKQPQPAPDGRRS